MPTDPNVQSLLLGMEKISQEHQRRILKLEARLAGEADPMKWKELETKFSKLADMTMKAQSAHGDLAEKVKQSIMLTAELAKPAAQVKMALAGIAALSKEIEALKKDQVSMADLKALEKRMLEAMKKAK